MSATPGTRIDRAMILLPTSRAHALGERIGGNRSAGLRSPVGHRVD
jgi:hypothetical protein